MLTPEEAAQLKAKQNALVDQYTATSPSPSPGPGPSPSPTPTPEPPSDYYLLAWPASGATRITAPSPSKWYFTVPQDAAAGSGRVSVAVKTGNEPHNSRSMIMSETPGGPPMADYAEIKASQTPTITFWIDTAGTERYPNLVRGRSYYVSIANGDYPPDQVWLELYP